MYRELNSPPDKLATRVLKTGQPESSIPAEHIIFPYIKLHYDGGSREEGAASAWVVSGRHATGGAWQDLAWAGFPLVGATAAEAETRAAVEAAKALSAYASRRLAVDNAGRVIPPQESQRRISTHPSIT